MSRHAGWVLTRQVALASMPIAVAAASWPFRDRAAAALALVLVLPVVGAAIWGGRTCGVVAALVGAVGFDFFLTTPYLSLRIHGADDVVVTVVLLAVGLIVAELVDSRRRSDDRADRTEADLVSLRRTAGLGAGGDDLGWMIHAAAEELSAVLGVGDVEYRPGPGPDHLPRLGHGRVTIPSRGPHPAGSPSRTVVIPVDRAGRHLAHFLVRFDGADLVDVDSEQRARAMVVADLLGAAIARAPRISMN